MPQGHLPRVMYHQVYHYRKVNSRGVPGIKAAKKCPVGGLTTLDKHQVSLVLILPKLITFLIQHLPGAVKLAVECEGFVVS